MARVFLDPNETRYIVSDPNTTVYGNGAAVAAGIDQTIILMPSAGTVNVDQNIGRVNLGGTVADYTFRSVGNILQIYDSTKTKLLISIDVQTDHNGTILGLEDRVFRVELDMNATSETAGQITIGNRPIPPAEEENTPTVEIPPIKLEDPEPAPDVGLEPEPVPNPDPEPTPDPDPDPTPEPEPEKPTAPTTPPSTGTGTGTGGNNNSNEITVTIENGRAVFTPAGGYTSQEIGDFTDGAITAPSGTKLKMTAEVFLLLQSKLGANAATLTDPTISKATAELLKDHAEKIATGGITGDLTVDKDSKGLLDKYTGTTATLDATGMSATEAKSAVGNDNKVATVTGDLFVDKDSVGLLDKYNGTSATVDATGMNPAQLSQVAATGTISKVDAVTGTLVFAHGVTTAEASTLAGKANAAATIKVDATNANKTGGYTNSEIETLVGLNGVSEVINIPDDANGDDRIKISSAALSGKTIKFSDNNNIGDPGGVVEIQVLDGATDLSGLTTDSIVKFHATVNNGADLRALGDDLNNKIEKITIIGSGNPNQITVTAEQKTYLENGNDPDKYSGGGLTPGDALTVIDKNTNTITSTLSSGNGPFLVNAADMSKDQLTEIVTGINKIAAGGISNLTLTNDNTADAATITALLGKAKAGKAVVNVTTMQPDKLVAVYGKLTAVEKIIGELALAYGVTTTYAEKLFAKFELDNGTLDSSDSVIINAGVIGSNKFSSDNVKSLLTKSTFKAHITEVKNLTDQSLSINLADIAGKKFSSDSSSSSITGKITIVGTAGEDAINLSASGLNWDYAGNIEIKAGLEADTITLQSSKGSDTFVLEGRGSLKPTKIADENVTSKQYTGGQTTDKTLSNGVVIEFDNGVDVINNFDKVNDKLNIGVDKDLISLYGESINAVIKTETPYYLSGSYDATTKKFTITEDGSGSDTLLLVGHTYGYASSEDSVGISNAILLGHVRTSVVLKDIPAYTLRKDGDDSSGKTLVSKEEFTGILTTTQNTIANDEFTTVTFKNHNAATEIAIKADATSGKLTFTQSGVDSTINNAKNQNLAITSTGDITNAGGSTGFNNIKIDNISGYAGTLQLYGVHGQADTFNLSGATLDANQVIKFNGGAGDDVIKIGAITSSFKGLIGNNSSDGTHTLELTANADLSGAQKATVSSFDAVNIGDKTLTLDSTQTGSGGVKKITGTGTGTLKVVGDEGANTIDISGIDFSGFTGTAYITPGNGADTIVLKSGESKDIIESKHRESVKLTALNDVDGDNNFSANDVITYGDGVNVIKNFQADNDILKVTGDFGNSSLTSAFGKAYSNGLTTNKLFYLSGAYDESGKAFTIAADGSGADTLVLQGHIVGGGNNAVVSMENNLSSIILVGVDSDDLVIGNFDFI